MPNILKARCICGSRATIIRTENYESTTILICRCDNKKCQRIFQNEMTFQKEIVPPIQQHQSKGFVEVVG
ncbi:hypothetical protein KJ966_24660 [bacterium]|nr:hypothetical protein [bacterium]